MKVKKAFPAPLNGARERLAYMSWGYLEENDPE